MEDKLNKIEKNVEELEKEAKNTYALAMHTLDLKNEENNRSRKCFLTIIIALIFLILTETCGFIYYISNFGILETTTEQEGIYNFIDSEGNAVSSDLSLEEMKELVELNGKN